ncbi:MAG: hypothetical protein ACYS76_08565 [Planctomycetota bacterium]|jgi:prepilin-type processing-associated H-X9-DG protein
MSRAQDDSQKQKLRTSRLAVLSLALAILSLPGTLLMFKLGSHEPANVMRDVLASGAPFVVLGAMVIGPISVVVIRKNKQRLKGTSLAVAATLVGVAAAILIIVAIKTMPRCTAIRLVSGTDLKGLGLALSAYARDYDGRYPPADKWCDVLIRGYKVPPDIFVWDQSDAVIGESSYAMNKSVAGRKPSELPGDVVVLFETKGGWNQSGGPEILSTENHKGKGCNILFNDGSVRFVKTGQLDALKWKVEEGER